MNSDYIKEWRINEDVIAILKMKNGLELVEPAI